MDRVKSNGVSNGLVPKQEKNELSTEASITEIAQIMKTTEDSITDVLAAAKRDRDEQMKSIMEAIKSCEAEYEWDNTTQFIFEPGKVMVVMNDKGRIAKDRQGCQGVVSIT